MMNVKNKTCLFCLKQRQILVDDPSSAKAIQKIYSIKLATNNRICIECHFNIRQIRDFKHTIGSAADIDSSKCFACISTNTVKAPGIDRVVGYLLKQCTTIKLGNTDTVKACPSCLYLLEICIKYEKLARNYSNAQRFCKQFATIKECNVALWKLDLDKLGNICENIQESEKSSTATSDVQSDSKDKKARKRGRGSLGEQDEVAPKRLKQDEKSVLPVMLTKLTPTVTPTRTEKKKNVSPSSTPGTPKNKATKQSEKFFIKLPIPKKLDWKKRNQHRKKYSPPHSPTKSIPASPSIEDLNRIFKVELRPLFIRIERVDLSSYLNRTIAHDTDTRQLRKPKKEEFIGLDEEDVVELQQSNNTSICSSVGKRKSILITERIESPYSAKKKVKFSDSPSIKYVDKLSFSEDENGGKESEDEKETDHKDKNDKKKNVKPSNGSPAATPNSKSRKTKKSKKDESEKQSVVEEKLTEKITTEAKEDVAQKLDEKPPDDKDMKRDEKRVEQLELADSNHGDDSTEAEICGNDAEEHVANVETENANIGEKPLEHSETESAEPITTSLPAGEEELSPDEPTAPMETEESEPLINPESTAAGESEQSPDAEMKDASGSNSPEDVEMVDTKSPPTEDVEMQEVISADFNGGDNLVQEISDDKLRENVISPNELSSADFEAYDKNEEEIEQVKLSLSDILGQEISDSEHGVNEHESQTSAENTSDLPIEKGNPDPEVESETHEVNDVCQSKLDENVSEAECSARAKNQSFSSLDDVDDISDDDDILDQLDYDDRTNGDSKRSPDLPPLGEDSL